jgi:hypothetical protein
MAMRVVSRGGRWITEALYIWGTEITPAVLQKVRLGQVDLMLSQAGAVRSLAEAKELYGTKLDFPYAVWEESAAGVPSLADLRALAENAPPPMQPWTVPSQDRPRLARPDGTDPDGFYGQVAKAYREYALQSRAPATALATEADVPVATARSWVREARRRGHLPPGRKGKAG